jgi:hypothetical protein
MEPKARPRSPEQIITQQRADADRDRERAAARPKPPAQSTAAAQPKPAAQPTQGEILDRFAKGPSQAIVPAGKREVAVPDGRTAHDQYLDEIAPASIVGRMIKFSKDGRFVTHDDGEPIPDNIDFVFLADQTLIGWIKFNGEGEPPDRKMGLLYNGYIMEPRETLGSLDMTKWELGLDGQPADPWQHHIYAVLQHGSTAELFTYVTSSVTGRRAIGNLLRHYDRLQKSHPDMYPVVRLKTGGFQHRDDRVGWVNTPVLAVVGRAPKDSAAQPDTSLAADMNDALPDRL